MKDLRTGDYSGDKTLSRENVEEVEDDLSSAIDQVVKYIWKFRSRVSLYA